MSVFSLALSRAVPLLFYASGVLLLARFGHDRLPLHSRFLRRFFFGAVLFSGMAAALPYAERSADVIRGSNAFQAGDYATASRCFDAYARAGGRFGPRLAYRWGVSLLNQHRWAAAEHALLSGLTRFEGQPTVAVQPRTMLALGLCRYYLGRLDAAAATLEVVEEKSLYAPRSYILGRIHEARGDARGAEALYAAVAERAPLFIPAAYQLVRLKMAAGEPEAAKTILAHAAGAKGRDADFDGLAGVIARNETPLPKEFVVVLKD